MFCFPINTRSCSRKCRCTNKCLCIASTRISCQGAFKRTRLFKYFPPVKTRGTTLKRQWQLKDQWLALELSTNNLESENWQPCLRCRLSFRSKIQSKSILSIFWCFECEKLALKLIILCVKYSGACNLSNYYVCNAKIVKNLKNKIQLVGRAWCLYVTMLLGEAIMLLLVKCWQ